MGVFAILVCVYTYARNQCSAKAALTIVREKDSELQGKARTKQLASQLTFLLFSLKMSTSDLVKGS